MTNLTGTPTWSDVPQLERNTEALGGPGGPMNAQAQALANRTEYLSDAIDALSEDLGGVDRRHTLICLYFPGWSTPGGGPSPSAPWTPITTYDSYRTPILGTYDEALQSITDTHLGWMRRYGIDVLGLDWFMQWSGTTLQPYLDHVLTNYKASTVDKPQLCIQFANQTNAGGLNTNTWPTVYNFWINNIFNDPNYYQIDGKPVVIVNSIPTFRNNFASSAQVKAMLDQARTAAIAAGYSGIFFMGGQADSSSAWTDVSIPSVQGWDGVTGSNVFYKTHIGDNAHGPTATSYADLDDNVFGPTVNNYRSFSTGWLGAANAGYYWPPVTAGYNAAPWNSGVTSLYGIPTLPEWIDHLVHAKTLLDTYPTQTLRTLIVQNWNEFGEGSILEPTIGNGGFDKLQALADVFER
jgi:hypothetical protein